jgi:hypothetical protein
MRWGGFVSRMVIIIIIIANLGQEFGRIYFWWGNLRERDYLKDLA